MLAAMPPPATSPSLPGDASARDRGDACPGTLRLHRADDGALARVRVPGGLLTAAQADALGALAESLGDGELHLTSRGNVQLRGLGPDCGGELAGRLGEAGLLPSALHERIRNIVASPLSGLDGRGARDVGPWLSALDALLCTGDGTAGLSGRFLFVLDDGRGDVDALGGDVTLLAQDDGTALLRIGTARTTIRIPGAQAPQAALMAAEIFLEQASGAGSWRVTDLPGGARSLLDEVVRRLQEAGDGTVPTEDRACPRSSDGPAPGVVTGPHDEAALSVGIPLGRIGPAQWRSLTDTARHQGRGELRLTPWRGVVVPGVERRRAAGLLDELGATGLVVGPDSPWTGVGACIGRPGCAKSLADVRAQAAAAVGPVGLLPVYWSGCDRRCGHPRGEWVDVVATPDGHRISVVRGEERDVPVSVPDSPGGLAAAVAAARRSRG
ncbi:precorrin-3B synthase [Streptomyces sp. NBC_01591]|uniref:precorrin-3B synthase n=1 Tax=Streptomyces sp. NBC_01591 TaxID=2975888 RepID=UPI002DD96F07|nr:precorrin-3B synthase [Streptomyces sp. NBC_01591]WSD73556.1 precorrin-3B synthase [Streptomyces sp. NBC_01591]